MSMNECSPVAVHPQFVFRNTEKSSGSVQLSTATVSQRSSSSSTRPPSTAKEVLLEVQKGSHEQQGDSSWQESLTLSAESKDLLKKKGIILHDLPTNEQRTNSKDDNNCGGMYFNDSLTQESVLCLNNLLTLNSEDDQLQYVRPLSPDSGYSNTPENLLKLPTYSSNPRSQSSTSETSDSNASTTNRRTTGTSSGIPSSLWSGHESTLELVQEEDDDDTHFEHRYRNERATSSVSDGSSDHLNPSPVSPDKDDPAFSNLSHNSQYYHNPDENTLIQLVPRRGVQRSQSTDDNNKILPGSYLHDESMNAIERDGGRSRRQNGGRNRSHSLFNKETQTMMVLDSKDTFQIQDELSKDNYHFALSDALISVIEEYKSLLCEQSFDNYLQHSVSHDTTDNGDSITRTMTDNMISVSAIELSSVLQQSSNTTSTAESDQSASSPLPSHSPPLFREFSLLRLVESPPLLNTAESTAHGMLQYIARVLGGGSQVEFRVPQVLQLPSDFISAIRREEQLQYSVTANSSPIRGGMDWAPPRKTIIHTMHTQSNWKDLPKVLHNQNNRCAGCGMIMDTTQFKFLRFCNYTGKYFCVSCHQNSLSCIPAHIISKWSFKRLPVSNFARDTLAKIEKEPLFNIGSLNPSLYYRIPELNRVKELREQLCNMKKYIITCSRRVELAVQFSQLEHLVSVDVHTYSLDDFNQVRSGVLSKQLKSLVLDAEKHIKTCPVCQGKGFVCEFCQDKDDIIYPFELNKISRCSECYCCFHKHCHTGNKECPRCLRIRDRQQKRLKTVLMNSDD